MYRVPPDRAWWPAVGAPLERGVRQHWARIVAGIALRARYPGCREAPWSEQTRYPASRCTQRNSMALGVLRRVALLKGDEISIRVFRNEPLGTPVIYLRREECLP